MMEYEFLSDYNLKSAAFLYISARLLVSSLALASEASQGFIRLLKLLG